MKFNRYSMTIIYLKTKKCLRGKRFDFDKSLIFVAEGFFSECIEQLLEKYRISV